MTPVLAVLGYALASVCVVFLAGVAGLVLASGGPWVGCPDVEGDPIDAETARCQR